MSVFCRVIENLRVSFIIKDTSGNENNSIEAKLLFYLIYSAVTTLSTLLILRRSSHMKLVKVHFNTVFSVTHWLNIEAWNSKVWGSVPYGELFSLLVFEKERKQSLQIYIKRIHHPSYSKFFHFTELKKLSSFIFCLFS